MIHNHLNSLDINGTWLPYNSCHSHGFMEAVMTTINSSWPHSDHIFLNNAQRASRLDDLTDASCSDAYSPSEVDLVLLDVASTLSSALAVEKIVRKYSMSRSDPVVIIFSQVQLCRAGEGRRNANESWNEERYVFCSRECLLDLNRSACSLLDPEPFPHHENMALDRERQPYQEIAVRYNQPHLNMHKLMMALLADKGVMKKTRGASKWELVTRIFMDHIHFQSCYGIQKRIKDGAFTASDHFPCGRDQGVLLLADVIVGWLQWVGQRETKRVSTKTSPKGLPPPIHNSSGMDTQYSIRCYGFSYQQVVTSSDTHDPLRIKEATVGTRNFGGFVQRESSLSSSFNPLPPLNITRADGWRLVNYYKKRDGASVFKPGLVANKEGSILELVVDSSFPQEFASQLSEVIVSYTESYDGWGRATLSCRGCQCSGTMIDARGLQRQSVVKSKAFEVTQEQNCVIRIEMRSSGKFKVNGVVVRHPFRHPR